METILKVTDNNYGLVCEKATFLILLALDHDFDSTCENWLLFSVIIKCSFICVSGLY